MKKSILNLGKALNKADQKNLFGGRSIDGCPDACYGVPGMGCRSCQEYFSLSNYYQMRVKVGVSCFGI